jgi:hypothetical protein
MLLCIICRQTHVLSFLINIFNENRKNKIGRRKEKTDFERGLIQGTINLLGEFTYENINGFKILK